MPVKKRTLDRSLISDDDISPTDVKRTKAGRPQRISAGRRSIPSGYVATDDAVDDDEAEASASDFDVAAEEEEEPVQPRRRQSALKKQREPSPMPDGLDDTEANTVISEEEDCYRGTTTTAVASPGPSALSLTFNVPPGWYYHASSPIVELTSLGHVGPFVVKLDLANLQVTQPLPRPITPLQSRASARHVCVWEETITTLTPGRAISPAFVNRAPVLSPVSKTAGRVGFLDLPAELRNNIYRQVLLVAGICSFPFPTHLNYISRRERDKLRPTVLATCRQIEAEAAQILYGDNHFSVARSSRDRGNYYEAEWHEIGWKDIRMLFQRIGQKNIGNIRSLTIDLHDSGSHSYDPEEKHRCVNDEHLRAVLKMLATYGRLQTLKIFVNTRKNIGFSDIRFLSNLQAAKADDIIFEGPSRYSYGRSSARLTKMRDELRELCVDRMQRRPRLYPESEVTESR